MYVNHSFNSTGNKQLAAFTAFYAKGRPAKISHSLNFFADLAKLILILNAASVHDPVCSLLPAFAVRHYKFLRCSMPLLVPTIEVGF